MYFKQLFCICIYIILPATSHAFFSQITSYFRSTCEVNLNYKTEIEYNLDHKVKGQAIAVSHTKWAIESHMREAFSRHALSIVFAGTTGTGKNFISSIISEAMLPKQYIHLYSGRNAFPDESKLDQYRRELSNTITTQVKICPRSIFIFDEIDKMPENLLDVVKPFLDFHSHMNNVDYRKTTFIFLTNIAGLEINTQYRILREQGIVRENMLYSHFEHHLRRSLFNEDGLMKNSQVISDHLISFYIPFLPLEKSHVKECILYEMSENGMPRNEQVVERVLENIDFNINGLSKSGCKRVSNFVAIERVRSRYEL